MSRPAVCLVSGAAGFIGSRLAVKLCESGHAVIGVDSFSDFYPRWIKERNLAGLRTRPGFEFIEADLNDLDLTALVGRVEVVFHLAAQAGVRTSWGRSFSVYLRDNIQATQGLLEAAKGAPGLRRFVYASSSSVYGMSPDLPASEDSPCHPLSPYGVSKLSAEQLCFLYHMNYGVPTTALRFFTVYGPGQRPDMAFHKFFRLLAEDKPVPIFGDGRQTRDFTFVDDIVAANLACLERGRPGEVYNIGGGHRETLRDLLPLFEEITGVTPRLEPLERQKGDVPHTFADIRKARADLGYVPRTALRDGLVGEWEWIRDLYSLS
ncbi:MAG: NAD-dependent epimerase/dehydratase family protein [Candidatus Aminicenantes bacterium]|nr:NAD-dependent epimerase/dehydratase family protein [Candidatus Aminicenantes bacterium]